MAENGKNGKIGSKIDKNNSGHFEEFVPGEVLETEERPINTQENELTHD